jgi:3-oxoacyl-[acyl-carrier protein] reductase
MSDKRVALVTGGASGLGLAMSRGLTADGFHVVMADVAENVQEVANATSDACTGVQCDLTSASDIHSLTEHVMAEFGRCDVLVNNAGVHPKIDGLKEDLPRLTLASWNKVLALHLTAPFLLSKLILPAMTTRGWGRIINISSRGGRTLIPNCGAHYAATKAGLIGLTRILAEEGAPYNVTANTVAPGRISTPLSNRTTSQVLERAVQAIPLKRIGEPDELASVVCFLASERSSYMTGTVIDVNGGSFMP